VFLLARQRVGRLVDLAVKADLVAIPHHRLDRRGIVLDAPGRHEEALLQAEAPIALEGIRGSATSGP
jgi:hypothetical protein